MWDYHMPDYTTAIYAAFQWTRAYRVYEFISRAHEKSAFQSYPPVRTRTGLYTHCARVRTYTGTTPLRTVTRMYENPNDVPIRSIFPRVAPTT